SAQSGDDSPRRSLKRKMSSMLLRSKTRTDTGSSAARSEVPEPAARTWAPSVEPKPETEAEAQATIELARLDSERLGLGNQFDAWISDRRLHRASELEIAHELWSAGATICQAQEESEANGTLPGLDAW